MVTSTGVVVVSLMQSNSLLVLLNVPPQNYWKLLHNHYSAGGPRVTFRSGGPEWRREVAMLGITMMMLQVGRFFGLSE